MRTLLTLLPATELATSKALLWGGLLTAVLTGACGSTTGAPTAGAGGSVGSGGSQVAVGASGEAASASGQSGVTGGTGGSLGSAGTGGSINTGGSSAMSTGGGESDSGATGLGGLAGGSNGGEAGGPPAAGGAAGAGGSTSPGGGASGVAEPCDLYQSASTPCVGAYSTVRALYRAYSGNLYQVRRTSDKTTRDIPVLSPGGFADSSVQDAFCAEDCTISILYDQSPKGNHLPVSPPVYWLKNGGAESDAKAARISVGGHTVYGVKGTAGRANTYRNNKTTGVATGDQPEEMYMVADSKYYSAGCCYDFGNVETSGNADGKGAMETLYWGGAAGTWGKGGGSGPWVMTDLELGVFGASTKNAASNTSLIAPAFVTLVMKGPSGNHFGLKGGDAQTGALITKWDGNRPSGWSPMKKQGAIVLGAGGDGSNGGSAIFFEGAITSGTAPDATDSAIQANIVAAGYGR